MKRLRDIGEFGLIARIEREARRGTGGAGLRLGIGDDAALFRPRAGEDIAISTDALVENVHFRWRNQAARTIGRRALAASLSDLAAMGARPLGVLLALAAPPTLELARVDGLVRGLCHAAREFDCALAGGNISAATETSLTVTAVGAVRRGHALTRTGARSGDRIAVTGVLGAMALELARAERGGARVRRVPTPRLAAGRALARVRGVGGCLDVSDGLEADLQHLLGPGGLAPEIDRQRLPRPRGFDAACARLGLDPERLLLRGGEDYELLFTLRPEAPAEKDLARRLGVPVREIGRVVPGPGPGAGKGPAAAGWRHF